MTLCCFQKECELEIQYVCLCLCSETYSCESHLQAHLELPNRYHIFDSIPKEPCEWTKATVLEFLINERFKKEKVRKIALASCSKICKESFKEFDNDLKEINSLIEKISQYSPKEEDSPLNELTLRPDSNAKTKAKLSQDTDSYNIVKLFCKLWYLKHQRFLILNKNNNDSKSEKQFRKTCLLYENNISDSLLSQAYQDYISSYQKFTSTYLIDDDCAVPNLFIYNTETETEEIIALEALERLEVSYESIIRLPNNDLLVNGNFWLIIDKNYQVRKLPPRPTWHSFSAIYCDRNIYCFGYKEGLHPSYRFNLDENRWRMLARIPKHEYDALENILFNKNILISGNFKSKILLYSIDIDSFSKIPYKFAKNKRKILMSDNERLYLIECGENAWVYECDIGNEYAWNKIAISIIDDIERQFYYSYNKGEIYISILYHNHTRDYIKFDLKQKTLTEIACYDDNLALKKLGDKLETIECYNQTFKLASDHAAAYIKKGCTLYNIAWSLDRIERSNKLIKNDSKYWNAYFDKGVQLHNLGRYIEAIDSYNAAIELKPDFAKNYSGKGDSLYKLKRYSEAIECYNESIKFEYDACIFFSEGKALQKINRNNEALEFYNKAISFDNRNYLYFCYRASLLSDLGCDEESIDNFNIAYELASCSDNYFYTYMTEIQDWLDLVKMLSNLQGSVVKFKNELQNIKDKNPGIFNEIGKKETVMKEQHSELLKKALKCLSKKYQSSETIEKMKKEVVNYQEAIADVGTLLSYCEFQQLTE